VISRPADLARKALGVLALVLAVLVARVLLGAHQELGEAQRAAQAGDLEGAMTHHRRAIGWYVPLSPHGPRAIAALERISLEQEARGERGQALLAARSIRAGIESARSTFTPYGSELARADARIAELRSPDHSTMRAGGQSPPDPSALFSMLAFAAWLGFVAAAYLLVTRASDAGGRFGARAWPHLAALVLCAGLFALGLALA
jgi:hypothetical protein